MEISSFEIRNFRMLRMIDINLENNLSLVIGKNNSGKTSFLAILQKFLSEERGMFSFDDFSIKIQKEIVSLEKKDICVNAYNEICISLKININYTKEDDIGEAYKLLLDLDASNNYFVIYFQYVLDYEHYKKMISDYKEYTEKGINRDFRYYINKNINKYFKIRIRALEYKNETNCKEITPDIVKSVISIQTIGAKRDVQNQQGNGNALSLLAGKYYNANVASDTDFPILQEQLRETDDNLTKTYEKLFKPIISEIQTMSYNPNEAKISILSSLSEKKIFQDNTLVKYEHENTLLPEDYNGLGYLNLFAIIFDIRIKLDKLSKKDKADERATPINLLFIEEPEAHTHPQMQYVFIKNIKSILKKHCEEGEYHLPLQTIISTHSSHIVSQCDFEDIKYFYRISNNTNIRCQDLKILSSKMLFSTKDKEGKQMTPKQMKEAKEKNYRFLKQYITLQRSELFFADKVVLIEGDTERILLSAMMKKFDHNKMIDKEEDYTPLLSQNISIVEVGAYSHIFSTFLAFLGVKTLVLTDLDPAKYEEKKKEKTGEPYMAVSKCEAKDSEFTTNASIKYFLEKEKIEDFLGLNSEKLTLNYNKSNGRWIPGEDGKLRIAFQKLENEYQASSFEDAFICLNLKFINDNKDKFTGLKNRKRISAKSSNYYSIANDCVKSKTSFALDILLHGGEINEDWEIPLYIKEGFEWLVK